MTDPLAVFDTVIEFARRAILALTAVLFGIFLIDWLVRTRRLSPFGPVARFFRGVVDPMLEPVDRPEDPAGGTESAERRGAHQLGQDIVRKGLELE